MNSVSDSSDRWYIKIADQIDGPFSSQDLQKQIQAGKISPDTFIRTENSRDWLPAKTFPKLFPKQESQSASESASRAAADLLMGRGIRRAVSEDDDEADSVQHRFVRLFSRLNLSWSREILSDCAEFLADKLEFLKYGFRLWVLVPFLLLISIGLGINYYAVDWYRRSIAYETYSEIWFELRKFREMDLNDRQWDEFKADAKPRISQINLSIEKVAAANDPYSMELLRAGRDCLPRMLDDARRTPSSSEKQFATHMNNAQRLVYSKSGKPFSQRMTDILGMSFIVFDIVLIGWGGIFFVRKMRT